MSNGFDEAKARRNWLERLTAKIPGFAGFQDRELRRDVDKMQREYLAGQLAAIKRTVREKARVATDAGSLGPLAQLDRLERRLDGLAQSIRFADYGASGFFDVVKFHDQELEKLYQFDLSFVEELAALASEVAALPGPGAGDGAAAAEAALAHLSALEQKWAGREQVVSGVVRTT
jgi:hypothetical protein